jgi:hypothetical protein
MRHPPKYVQAFIDRNGKPRFYFRRPGFKSVPLPGLPWSPQFMEVYESALSGQPLQIGASKTKPGTVSAAIVSYYYDQSFLALAPSTQRPLRGILERFRAEHGDKRLPYCTASTSSPCLDRRSVLQHVTGSWQSAP